jgi:hypothetical protein
MNPDDLRRAFTTSNPQVPPLGRDSPPLLSGVQNNMGLESVDLGIGNSQILEFPGAGLGGNIVDALDKGMTNLTGCDIKAVPQINIGSTAPSIGDVAGNTKGMDVGVKTGFGN